MTGSGWTAHEPRWAPLRIVAGGAPAPRALAALAAAVTALVESEAVAPPDPVPAAYRSRWRRAGLIEGSEVPAHVKDAVPPWGAG